MWNEFLFVCCVCFSHFCFVYYFVVLGFLHLLVYFCGVLEKCEPTWICLSLSVCFLSVTSVSVTVMWCDVYFYLLIIRPIPSFTPYPSIPIWSVSGRRAGCMLLIRAAGSRQMMRLERQMIDNNIHYIYIERERDLYIYKYTHTHKKNVP